MAKEISSQSAFQLEHVHKQLKGNLGQQTLSNWGLHLPKMGEQILDKHGPNTSIEVNEIEVISDEELPSEDQPEDGELSEIRLVFNEKGCLLKSGRSRKYLINY